MDGKHYKKWFVDTMLFLLPPASVVVTNNAPCHSLKLEKVPKMSTFKKEIQAWLSAKGAAWSLDMIKVELLKIDAMTRPDGKKKHRIDTIAAAAGHTV